MAFGIVISWAADWGLPLGREEFGGAYHNV
jgi:hypothetical protein